VRVQHLFVCGLRVTLLRYYLGISQLLIRSSRKKKFAVKGRTLVHYKHQIMGEGSDADVRTFCFKIPRFYGVSALKKGLKQCGQG